MHVNQFRRRRRRSALSDKLGPLRLSNRSIAENAAEGAIVGSVESSRRGSTIWLDDNANDRFALRNGAIVRGSVALDYEALPAYAIILRESNVACDPPVRQTVITIAIENLFEQPALEVLSLSATGVTEGEPAMVRIIGAKEGSSIDGSVPDGLLLNSPTRVIEGTPTMVGGHAFTLTETLGDSVNSPRTSVITMEVAEAAPKPAGGTVIMAIIAGQSNSVGRNYVAGDPNASTTNPGDPDPARNRTGPDIFQFVGAAEQPDYRTLTNDILYLDHQENTQRIGPGLSILHAIEDRNPSAKIVAVPCGRGSSGVLNGTWLSDPADGGGGTWFENMIDQSRRAIDAIHAQFPQARIEPRYYWVQGEQDANESRAYGVYKAALSDIIDRSRSRIAAKLNIANPASIPWIIGSMVPRKYTPDAPAGYNPAYAVINRAHVDLAMEKTNVLYAQGPDELVPQTNAVYVTPAGVTSDNLHYQPHAAAREQGERLEAIHSDIAGPTITNADAQGSQVDTGMAIALKHDDPFGHATMAIFGGADAELFELSDHYAEPGQSVKLRWAGNGTGPAIGTYEVELQARDGAGNVGPVKAFSIKVTPTYGIGDQGAVTVTSTYTEENYSAGFGGFTRSLPIRRGLNIFAFHGSGGSNRDSSFALTVDGMAATKLVGNPTGANLQTWSFISAVDKNAAVAASYSGSGGTYMIVAAALTGSKAMPLSIAMKPWSNANGSKPFIGTTMSVPSEAMLLCFAGSNAGPLTAVAPSMRGGLSSPNGQAALFTRDTSDAVQFNSGSFSGAVSLVFERSV